MKRKMIAGFLAAGLALSIMGCSTSSTSTSSVTTSFTDENGETTTHTVTTTEEDGNVNTEESTTVEKDTDGVDVSSTGEYVAEESIEELKSYWQEQFHYGVEGVTNGGDTVYFAYDKGPEPSFGAMMILQDDTLTSYNYGQITDEGDYYVITDVDGQTELRFTVTASEGNTMTVTFSDGDVGELEYVDQDVIIDDMLGIIDNIRSQQ